MRPHVIAGIFARVNPPRYGLTAELMDACANLQFAQLMQPEHWRADNEFFRGGPVLCDAPAASRRYAPADSYLSASRALLRSKVTIHA